jgi:hypothetical protein
MKKLNHLISLITILGLTCGVGFTQTSRKPKGQSSTPQQAVTPAASSNPVTGSGTVGRIAKWTGVDGANSFTLGNTNIFEDKFGKVGIGTLTPTSPLTVQGMIETTLGGYKFPDGTIQTTASVTGLQSVFHDTTLTGNGTSGSPLGVAIPLILSGNVSNGNGVITVNNTAPGGTALFATGGNGEAGGLADAGTGVMATGGNSSVSGLAGIGLVARGGHPGGPAIRSRGADETQANGGTGIEATGGSASGAPHFGGIGIRAVAGTGTDDANDGLAGAFIGDVTIVGKLNVTGTKNFKIDHPLDPENKYLYHAAIESSEVLNVYSGNVTTDGNGEAVVTLPEWFESINKDFRYQLTVVGTFAQAIVGNKIKDNRFTIKTNAANIEVSWQVTGVRSDAAILKHPFKLEENKPQSERGSYLTPDAYNQPEERGIKWARNPERMDETQPTRAKQTEVSKPKAQDRDR